MRDISWRTFLVLVRGLSPNSATVTKMMSMKTFGRKHGKVNSITGPKATQSAFESLFGPPVKNG